MFKVLYDGFLQALSGSWPSYIQKNAGAGNDFREIFYSKMYPAAGIYWLLFTIMGCLVYYYYFNARFGNYYTLWKYILTALLTAALIALLTFATGRIVFRQLECPTTGHLINLCLINFLYSLGLFFFVSLIVKRKSPMGKKTPF